MVKILLRLSQKDLADLNFSIISRQNYRGFSVHRVQLWSLSVCSQRREARVDECFPNPRNTARTSSSLFSSKWTPKRPPKWFPFCVSIPTDTVEDTHQAAWLLRRRITSHSLPLTAATGSPSHWSYVRLPSWPRGHWGRGPRLRLRRRPSRLLALRRQQPSSSSPGLCLRPVAPASSVIRSQIGGHRLRAASPVVFQTRSVQHSRGCSDLEGAAV